ncbi:hypothetical protein GGR57DRAFT_471172 [Xylariaceae sp. FL1272]|nr:hypothetical protein GGR57DRAFT_471172 [Xylariaceae sp. FL1272]
MFGASAPAVSSESVSQIVHVDHSCEYRIRDLPTRSVTLFPSSAQVIRHIADVSLKTGTNLVTIKGLSPTVISDSIKVEGTGSAVITDLLVELLPNRDIFEEVYPDTDDEDSVSDSSSDDADDGDFSRVPEITEVRDRIRQLEEEKQVALEAIRSAESRMKLLDAHGDSVAKDRENKVDITEALETYRTEREKIFRDHLSGNAKDAELCDKIASSKKEERHLVKRASQDRAKARLAKNKMVEKQRRKEDERFKERRRIRRERESFWPRQVYTVKLTLEVASFTPSTSRRSSIMSDAAKPVIEKPSQDSRANAETIICDLTLSYVTNSAFWSPTYDLALSTTNGSGILYFDAHLTNKTSETWESCKVILSTSQTESSSLAESIPELKPWHVRLAGKSNLENQDILYSRDEFVHTGLVNQRNFPRSKQPRSELFGLGSFKNPSSQTQQIQNARGGLFGIQAQKPQSAFSQSLFGGPSAIRATQVPHPVSLFGSSNNAITSGEPHETASANGPFAGNKATTGALFGSSSAPRGSNGGLFGSASARRPTEMNLGTDHVEGVQVRNEGGAEGAIAVDEATLAEPEPDLEFEESVVGETGLTTTYDLPGVRCLPPSSTMSKQRVVRMTYSNVVFKHVVVAKCRKAAFLKTSVRNTSKLTLLKGQTSLTLDGSFFGRTTLPRCSPGETFTLSLGVDPSIRVTYPKPEVKRSSSSMFSLLKENITLYTRVVTLVNTRTDAESKPAHITLLDQIPVSEDERLAIELLKPKGLAVDGPRVSCGEAAPGSTSLAWGKADAHLETGGEVSWDVKLNAGKSVKFVLEYSCAVPSLDQAINA